MRMNQSLKEFMKTMNKSSTDTNIELTNLDEDDIIKSPNSYSLNNKYDDHELKKNTLNSNSTTAEFRKYLEDLTKDYLEKLTFSCPSKLIQSASSSFERVYNQKEDMKLKSVENINNLISRKVLATPVTSYSSNNPTRRSLFLDKNQEDNDLASTEKLDEEIKTEKMFETVNIFSLHNLNNQ